MAISTDTTIAPEIPRRGFLRQLCALPMIGGGVTLIGQPTAAAVPVTRDLLSSYATWLNMERRFLNYERAEGDRRLFDLLMDVQYERSPAGRFVHYEPMPSTRAALVLSAVGVPVSGGAQ